MAWTSESVPSTGSNWTAEAVPSYVGWTPESTPVTSWKHTGHFGWAITSATETGSTTLNSSFTITITFDEIVVDFDATDFNLINCTISSLAGSGKVYTATCTKSYFGQITVAILNSRVTDDKGNKNSIGTPFSIDVQPSIMTSSWTLSGGERTIKLPLISGGNYNFDIDWGDETISTVTAWNQVIDEGGAAMTHTYEDAGVKNIEIGGASNYTITGWQFANGGDKLKIRDISNWGPLNISTNQAFRGCTNLNITANNAPGIDTNDLTDTFSSCNALTSLGSGGNTWDVSTVNNLSGMFYSCFLFDGDISNWNTAAVTNMYGMFQSAKAFNQNIGGWDTSSVATMTYMFYGAWAFNEPIGSWNTAALTGAQAGIFGAAKAFNQPINTSGSSWDVSGITNMSGLFNGATAFNQDISDWNTAAVTNMAAMFQGCVDYNHPMPTDGNKWNTASVTSMSSMFSQAFDFNQNIGNWNTSSVTNMGYMLYGTAFNQDISSWTVAQVTNFTAFLQSTTALSTANYNLLLHHWEADNPTDGLSFHGGDATHDGSTGGVDGTAALNRLVTLHGWTITDADAGTNHDATGTHT